LIVRTITLAVICIVWSLPIATAGGPADFMMIAHVEGQQIEGLPLLWDQRDMLLLGRDGVLHQFPNKSALNARKINRGFTSYTLSEMRSRLREEFGRDFDVSTTQHFIVVHPRGRWSEWAERMESLYRTFLGSMRVRGIKTTQPLVPLVAVVFRNRAAYYRYAKAHGTTLQPDMLGHYDPKSNRVLLFDDGQSSQNLDTIVHEATHQTAYNVGAHRRFAEQPSWLVEGLAMMFETPGMRQAWTVHTRKDRINRSRLDYFRKHLEKRPKDALVRLISSDQRFRTDGLAAYSEAWVLTFYLFETHPREYSRYLARVAARKAFSSYSSKARHADFASAFGEDLTMLNVQMLRFVEEL